MVCACALACQRVSETAQVRQRGRHNTDKRPLLVLFASGANREMHVWIDSVLVRGVTFSRNGPSLGMMGAMTGVDKGLGPSFHTWGLKRRNP